MLKPTLLPLLLLCLCVTLNAQREDLSADLPFFEQKAAEYQRWIEAKGIGEVLEVERVRLKVDRNRKIDSTEIELFLLFKATDADTAMAKWDRLKKDFDTRADSLEAFLFRTFIHKMEIPETQGNIQIYIPSRETRYLRGTHIWIWWENGRIITQKVVGVNKSKEFEISIPYKVSKTGKGQSAKVKPPKRRSPDAVFNRILRHVKTTMLDHPRYKTELNDRKPQIENDSLRTATTFKFTVANLGKEVLTNENRAWWENWVGINTIPMERLTFRFEYLPEPAPGKGYSLKCIIDGKFGSGVFKPRTSGYMNMEPDFDDFFEQYKNDFRLKLLNLLQQKP